MGTKQSGSPFYGTASTDSSPNANPQGGPNGLIIVVCRPKKTLMCLPAIRRPELHPAGDAEPTPPHKRLAPPFLAQTPPALCYTSPVTGITGIASADSQAGRRAVAPHQAAHTNCRSVVGFGHPHPEAAPAQRQIAAKCRRPPLVRQTRAGRCALLRQPRKSNGGRTKPPKPSIQCGSCAFSWRRSWLGSIQAANKGPIAGQNRS